MRKFSIKNLTILTRLLMTYYGAVVAVIIVW